MGKLRDVRVEEHEDDDKHKRRQIVRRLYLPQANQVDADHHDHGTARSRKLGNHLVGAVRLHERAEQRQKPLVQED